MHGCQRGRWCCVVLAQSCLSLAYEELADLVEENCLAPAIIQWITEHIAAEFADRCGRCPPLPVAVLQR